MTILFTSVFFNFGKKAWKFMFKKCPFFYHLGSFLWQLHRYLSQNWDSDCHFEVLNESKSLLDQKLWHYYLLKSFFHAWKRIISGVKYQIKFWHLRRKLAVRYHTCAIISRSLYDLYTNFTRPWFETALDYKSRIFWRSSLFST